MKKYEAVSRKETKGFSTEEIRENFLIESIFKKDEIVYNYSYYDRVIIGGAMPGSKTLEFKLSKELGVDFFLQRREIGLINIGGDGVITIDGKTFDLTHNDGIYIGPGKKKVTIKSNVATKPMKLYFMSTPGLIEHPTTIIEFKKAKPLPMGADETLNKRTIYQYFHPATCKTNQLLMGMTVLEKGSVWNTMPCHTHERRMEAYFYFDMEPETRVFHMHGEPTETRHIIMKNEEAILSPPWSIHAGVATNKYAFIWAMAGENQTFTDMQAVKMEELK